MSCPTRNFSDSLLKRSLLLILPLFSLLASPALAEPLLLLNNGWNYTRRIDLTRLKMKQQDGVCLNENGDLVIRNGDISLTLAYNPVKDMLEPQKGADKTRKEDNSSISGISIKLAFLF